ncbi:serine aminopeptidase domain-containing protein [Ascidiimonas aurantiaca]|uniref:alpha/beta hydrolase family protein n=1 Tax=Ascidiimonas aurantiaca TaxID=1685432 RepID=UPI0030EEC5E5
MFREIPLVTSLGHTLQVRQFQSSSKRGAVIISSATGVLQNYYYKFALFLNQNGFTVYTFDYYGIGKTGDSIKKLKSNTITLSEWGNNDQASVLALARNEHPSEELTLISHSIGGQLFGLNPNYHMVNKAIMVASQSGYWKYYKGIHSPKMWLFWHVMIPALTPVFGYFPAKKIKLFENLPKNVAYEWKKWGKHKDYMFGSVSPENLYFKDINIPMLFLGFPRDIFAPKEAIEWLASRYSSAQVENRYIIPENEGLPEIGHFGFFRENFRKSLWASSLKWIEKEAGRS